MSLDLEKTYEQYDKEEVSYGIEHLPQQIRAAWEEIKTIPAPERFKKVQNVCVIGMGGSALGAHMVQAVFGDKLRIPMTVVSDYRVPAFVGRDTLVILSSFSGSTEEVREASKEVKKRKAKTFIIGAKGPLLHYARRSRIPHYRFDASELAKQPRLGTMFSFTGIAGYLHALGILKIANSHVQNMMSAMGDVIESCALDVATKENPAKIVATELVGQEVLIVASEHLAGNAHLFRNQIEETAKQLARFELLPELNHHFLEGCQFPENRFEGVTVLMLRSDLYHDRTKKRYDITANMLESCGATVIDYTCGGGTRLDECGEIAQYGSFVSYYLAMLNKVNPETNAFVDKFKKELNA